MRSIVFLFLLITTFSHAQVTLSPFFANENDTIIVTYDASQGNGALDGQTQIYAHTGVITSLSSGPTDWRHVVGNWGTADPQVAMTNQGNNIHTIEIDIQNFYNPNAGETIEQLAFVFRTEDGSLVGRTASGGDIFVPLYNSGFGAALVSPSQGFQLFTSHQSIELNAQASAPATIQLFVDDSLLAETQNATELDTVISTAAFGSGKHYIWMQATTGATTIRDSSYYLIHSGPSVQNPPSGLVDGINYTSDSTVTLQFSVPFKDFIYVIGDFNSWELDPDYLMKKSADNNTHWLELSGLTPGKEYRFQYVVNPELMKIADIFAEKVLDPWNDGYISNTTYPDLIPYPTGKTTDIVSVLQTAQSEYQWDNSINFERPSNKDLVIYELLVRDFIEAHDYQALIDSLDYLARLGVNAIELMPFNEFEGNNSWGYNPSFYFAPDKYYGTANDLKQFIEEAHRRGIAVIMDMVLNHSFGQNPQVRLFFDPSAGPYGQPTAQNPWFLETPAHDFNVGYDYDHESVATRRFVDRVMKFWLEEYRIDGYRMDLSKGFTSNVTIGDIGAFGQYDASRVFNLKRMADKVWEFDSTAYIILEHFAENDEEKELAEYGFMLWGNANHSYSEAVMGYGDDFSWVSHKSRGWNVPHVVGYAESHDEERIVYKNKEFGKVQSNYSVKDPSIALQRAELVPVFLLGIPGPKMIWQFGELGYDFSINTCEDGTISEGCRLSPKPIKWNYFQQSARRRIYDIYRAMNHLRSTYPTFSTSDFEIDLNSPAKVIRLNHPEMNAVIVGNFDVVSKNIRPEFQNTGTWHEYFSGESLEVNSTDDFFTVAPGEYRIYTDQILPKPDITASVATVSDPSRMMLFPNPASDRFVVHGDENILSVTVRSLTGKIIYHDSKIEMRSTTILSSEWPAGSYLVETRFNSSSETQFLILNP